MKQFAIPAILASVVALAACGSGNTSNSGTINGNWNASLTNPDSSPAFAFTASLAASNGSSTLTISNFSFTTAGSCFTSQTTETGTFGLAGNFNGNVSGSFGMQISTTFPGSPNNVLTLQGTVNNNTITGTWNLTGVQAGCTGSGNFTMNKM